MLKDTPSEKSEPNHKIFRTIIIDDEEKARKNLLNVLKQHTDVVVVAEAENAESGLREILNVKPDLLFLDIKMPQQDGFQLLDELGAQGVHQIEVIFLTAYSEYAIKAFKVAAFDYLLKPVDPELLSETMERLRKKSIQDISLRLPALKEGLDWQQAKLRFNSATGFVFIHPQQIMYIEAEGSYCRIYNTENTCHLVSRNMKYVEALLDPLVFKRVHKSFLINSQYLTAYEKERRIAVLSSPTARAEVPVSFRLAKNISKEGL